MNQKVATQNLTIELTGGDKYFRFSSEYSNAVYLFKCLFTEHIEKLKTTYDHVDDIDLFVGGFLEPRIDDAVIGATFRCIIADVFARLKYGDR